MDSLKMDEHKYEMSINLNVLNHLGLKLYSNVPAVLSEVVANSWDADAKTVDIEITHSQITITDDGQGMVIDDINNKYLMVGYERRQHEAGHTPRYGRTVMGRKGIGKLSLFSIANTVEVQTIKEGYKNGFVMSLQQIQNQIMRSNGNTYYPDSIPDDQITLGKVGTRIVLKDLRKRVFQAPIALKKRLARRFSIIGDKNFTVNVNGDSVQLTDRDYFHKLQYIWYYGEESEKYIALCNPKQLEHKKRRNETIDETTHRVTGWIGTVLVSGDLKDHEAEDNLNKIVVMVRGKLAQEDILEDFPEGGLYTKYLIGEIHADFLDRDDQEDIATSNRQEIIKDDERYQALRNWVKDELNYVRSQWTDLRTQKAEDEARQIPAIDEWVQGLNKDIRRHAKSMFGKIAQLPLDPDDKRELYKDSVLAFEKLRYKGSLSSLDRVSPENIQEFTKIFAELDDIEASLYYQIIRERLKVIDTLRVKAKDNVVEKVIQNHLYEHLWLLDPSWDRATETPFMEQRVRTEFEKLNANLSPEEEQGRYDIKYKMTSGKHVIIELKRAGRKLDDFELQGQVNKYRNALRKILREAGKDEPIEVVCLVGEPLNQWASPEEKEESRQSLAAKSIRVVLYQQLIEDAYRSYNAFLQKNLEAGRVYQLVKNI